jgi:hypothetical protein
LGNAGLGYGDDGIGVIRDSGVFQRGFDEGDFDAMQGNVPHGIRM